MLRVSTRFPTLKCFRGYRNGYLVIWLSWRGWHLPETLSIKPDYTNQTRITIILYNHHCFQSSQQGTLPVPSWKTPRCSFWMLLAVWGSKWNVSLSEDLLGLDSLFKHFVWRPSLLLLPSGHCVCICGWCQFDRTSLAVVTSPSLPCCSSPDVMATLAMVYWRGFNIWEHK